MIKQICEVITKLKEMKYKAYLVGGSSRDLILTRDFSDVDIATNAPLNVIAKTFTVINDEGKSMGSIKIEYKHVVMELTRFRIEEYDNKSTYPHVKEFINDEEEDAKRRDFTINCIYLDPTNNNIVDPFDGLRDLMSFKIKFIGDPTLRIKEDPTRILRGIRIAYKMGFSIDEETNKAFIDNISELDRISNGRYKKEINKFTEDLGEIRAKAILNEYNIKNREEEKHE